MTHLELLELVDNMLESAMEANRDFDHLVFGQEAFPVGGDTVTVLGANLDYLHEKLDELSRDLRTDSVEPLNSPLGLR